MFLFFLLYHEDYILKWYYCKGANVEWDCLLVLNQAPTFFAGKMYPQIARVIWKKIKLVTQRRNKTMYILKKNLPLATTVSPRVAMPLKKY